MSTHIKYNITTVVGSYQKDGETKKRYATVGKVMEKDDQSRFILIDPTFNFAAVKREEGRDMVICSLMEPKDNNKQSSGEEE